MHNNSLKLIEPCPIGGVLLKLKARLSDEILTESKVLVPDQGVEVFGVEKTVD